MAVKPLLRQLLLWTTISVASASQAQLVDEVSALIPTCAQSCFESFIDDNFSSACGTSPSLQCLCSHQTQTGFTIGEEALECIVAINTAGGCQQGEVTSSVILEAYGMCQGQVDAVPNTHPTLTATVIVPSSSKTGVIVIVAPTVTSSLYLASSSVQSTITSTSNPASFPTIPPTATTSQTIGATSSVTASPQTSAASTPATLGTTQIIGISVGVAGAIILALLAIVLARRVRKRKYPDIDEGFFPMDEKSSFGGGVGGAASRLSSRLTKVFHISPPILKPQRWDEFPTAPQPQPQYPLYPPYQPSPSQTNLDRNTIGLAISRPRSEVAPKRDSKRESQGQSTTLQRKPSKLLPPKPLRTVKPALTLNIPSAIHPALRPESSQPPQTDRTSTMTNMTAFADIDTEAPESAQIWRPPPSDPQSATTYYVADKWGNWVLGNNNRQPELAKVAEAAELDTYTPLTKSPIEKKEEAAQMVAAMSAASEFSNVLRPAPAFLKIDPAAANLSRSSSLYSQASAVRPGPQPLQAIASTNNSAGQRKSSRSDSKDSGTTIETSSSSGGGPFDEDMPIDAESGHLSMLSPVAESPQSPTTGRSPVTYPKIPGRLAITTIRHVPPPKFPNFTSSPPGQPSPTLGAVLPVRSSPSAYPQPLNPKRHSQMAGRTKPPPQTTGSGFSPVQPSRPTFPIPPLNSPRSATRQPLQNPPRIDTRQPPRTHISSFISPTSATTISSATSSLLAKRVGNERAAALSLENGKGKSGAWRRNAPGGADGLLSPEMAGMVSPRMILPSTPTWQPKLTPTRRGDDLFLSVQ